MTVNYLILAILCAIAAIDNYDNTVHAQTKKDWYKRSVATSQMLYSAWFLACAINVSIIFKFLIMLAACIVSIRKIVLSSKKERIIEILWMLLEINTMIFYCSAF